MKDSPEKKPRYSLVELARRSGTPGRTIRYYIAQGLLPGPHERGRHAWYGSDHLEQLAAIQRLKEQGCALSEIRRRLGRPPLEEAVAAPEAWFVYRCGKDVIVQVRATTPPWRLRRIHALIRDLTALEKNSSQGGTGHE